jgi:hypothetical protein
MIAAVILWYLVGGAMPASHPRDIGTDGLQGNPPYAFVTKERCEQVRRAFLREHPKGYATCSTTGPGWWDECTSSEVAYYSRGCCARRPWAMPHECD